MNSKLKLPLAAALLIALGLALWFSAPDPSGQASVPEVVPAASVSRAREASAHAPAARQPVAPDATDPVSSEPSALPAQEAASAPAPPLAAPPAGCLRIVATQAGAPLAGRTVWLSRTRSDWFPREVERADESTSELILDVAGQVERCSLQAGDYLVGIESSAKQMAQFRVALRAQAGQLVRFELGDVELHGCALDADGEPAEGALVLVSEARRAGMSVATWTNGAGAYRLQGLSASECWIALHLDGSPYSEMQHSLRTSFMAGESRRLDFGPSAGWHSWSGALRNRAGELVEGVGDEPVPLTLARLDGAHERRPLAATLGRFSLRLAPGEYRVLAIPPGHARPRVVLETLTVGEADLERDLVLPGTRVRGQLRQASTGAPMRVELGGKRSQVRAHLAGHLYPAAFLSVPIDAEGRYCFESLDAGDWKIGLGSQGFEQELELRIEAADVDLVLDLPTSR